MTKYIELMIGCNKEITEINNVIGIYEKELASLKAHRRGLLSKMRDLDMGLVLECIEESGLTAEEVIKMVDLAAKGKKKSISTPAC